MRQALTDFHKKLDADLDAIEGCIRDYLRQAERLFADRGARPDLRMQLAERCQKGLIEFRAMRNRLLAKRELMGTIQVN